MKWLRRAKIHGTEGGNLILDRSDDGDVWVTIVPDGSHPSASIRICTRNGGGNTPNTRKALVEVMAAIDADGGDCSE